MSGKHHGSGKPHPQPNQSGSNDHERKISGDVHVRGEIEANVPTGFIEQYKAARQENTPRDNWRFFVEILTLIFVVIYAGLTAWIAYTSQQQARTALKVAELTRDQFTKDQRPYLWYWKIKLDPLVTGNRITAMVSYRNVGKSPALYIWTPEFIVEHGPNSQKMIDKYFEFLDTQDVSKINSEYDSSVLVPEIPTDTSTFQSHPAYGLGALTTDDVQNISTQKEFVFVAGRINYKDMAKNSYHSDFCIVINNDNNYANCQNHNDIQ